MKPLPALVRLAVLRVIVVLAAGLAASALLVDAAPVGNERQEEYRAPWPERYRFYRDGGCPVQANLSVDPVCTGHVGLNQWAIDMNDFDRPGNADCGDPMKAARSGAARLIRAIDSGGYGNLLGINHVAFNGGQTSTWYAHLASPSAAPWDTVFAQGDWVGSLGGSGTNPLACHLHFQLDLGFGSPLDAAQTSNLVLSGSPPLNGFDLVQFSGTPWPSAASGDFASNNTGPGYARPGAPPNLDPGPVDAPLPATLPIRNYVRNLAVYGVDYGSTKASTRGPCGANRRWVKSCSFGPSGIGWTQGFVSQGFFGDIPRALVEDPANGSVFSVNGRFWKAYGRKCGGDWAYAGLGFPLGERVVLAAPNVDSQLFQRGRINVNQTTGTVTVSVAGFVDCTFTGVADTNNDPCYDVTGDGAVNLLDLSAVAAFYNLFETDPRWNDRFDMNRDGKVNVLDLSRMSQPPYPGPCP